MASGKTSKAARRTTPAPLTKKSFPWGIVTAVVVLVAMVAVIGTYVVMRQGEQRSNAAALAPFTPSATNPDPSTAIPGIVIKKYTGGQHVGPDVKVAYTNSPPFGGTHDGYWAACNGVVYPKPVRSENMVHALEHGSVWIAYNPDKISGDALKTLSAKIDGQPYSLMSPYPNLDQPISLQSWGHQLKLSDPNDPRIDEFIQSLRSNQYQYPEPGASCAALGPGQFDQDNPPPFAPAPPVSAVNNTTVMPEVIAGAQGVTPDPVK